MGNPIPPCERVSSDCVLRPPPPSPIIIPSSLSLLEARVVYFEMKSAFTIATNNYIERMQEIGMPVFDGDGQFIEYDV